MQTTTNEAKEAMTIAEFAKREFALAAERRDPSVHTDGTAEWIAKIEGSVIQMLEKVDDLPVEDRSRWLALSLFSRLSVGQVVTPLLGEEGEWEPFGEEGLMQNKRCPHVFKRPDGTAYDARAIVRLSIDGTVKPDGFESRDVVFPYMPKQEVLAPGQQSAARANPELKLVTE
jgi:hypothetical protein